MTHIRVYQRRRGTMQSRGSAGSPTAVSYVSSRRHHHQSMAFRGPLSLLWLALSAAGPAACFVVLPASTRVAVASPLPKVVLGSRQGAHGVVRSRSDGSGGQEQRRLFGFTRRFEQERAGEEGRREEKRAGGEGDAAIGVGSAPAAHHAFATGIRRARALAAATGLSRGKGFGFRKAAALKASAPGEVGGEDTATTTGGERSIAAPATPDHASGASTRRVKSLVAMVGLSRGKGSRATASALKASATGADVAPPADTSAAGRPKKILIIMSDTGGGHRASSQALSAALENLYGDQVRM